MTPQNRPPIVKHLRQVLTDRGHTMADAEREMGIGHSTLMRVMNGETVNPGTRTIEYIAGYLGLPFQAVRNWFYRDYQRSERFPRTAVEVVEITERTLTFDGWLEPRYDPPRRRENSTPDCGRCKRVEECRQCAYIGKPLPCERMLAREIVPDYAVAQVEVGL